MTLPKTDDLYLLLFGVFSFARLANQDVFESDVSMNESLAVQVLDGLEKLPRNILYLLFFTRPLSRLESLINVIKQTAILNVFLNDVEINLIMKHLINVYHRSELALLIELQFVLQLDLVERLVTHELFVDYLDGAFESRLDVDCLLDDGHLTCTQLMTKLVMVVDTTADSLQEFDLLEAEVIQMGLFLLDHCLKLLVLFEDLDEIVFK